MSTTQHTGHYNLPTFGDDPNDRPSWRGDFTDAMTKIDNQMYTNATNITTATAAANNAKTAAQQAKESADNAAELAQTNKTDIGELEQKINSFEDVVSETYTTKTDFTNLNNAATKTYQFHDNRDQTGWYKLGTWSNTNQADVCAIMIYAGEGRNGKTEQNREVRVFIKDSFQFTESASGAFGVTIDRIRNADNAEVQVRATAADSCDVWYKGDTPYAGGRYTISIDPSSKWTHSGSFTTSAPSSGTLQTQEYQTYATKSYADTTFTKQGGYTGTAQQLNQRITEVDNKIHGFMPWRKTYDNIVIVGDSITYGTGASSTAKSWGNLFKDYIGAQSVQNLAQNGAGFVTAPTFLSQLQSAANKEAVTHVIIAGGANDKGTDDGQVTTAVVNTLKYALENFPNATIHVAPVLLGVQGIFRYDHENSNVWSTLNAIEGGVAQVHNVHEIRYAWEWLNGRQDWASTSGGTLDAIHPNDAGHQQLLRLMAESLFTENSIHNNWSCGVSSIDHHATILHSSSTCSNGVYDFTVQLKMANNHQGYQGIAQTCYGLTTAYVFHVNSSYTAGDVFAYVGENNVGAISCRASIPNGTEIYMTAHHYIGA